MKQTALTALLIVSLAIGSLLYSTPVHDNSIEQQFNSWKNEFNIGKEMDQAENLYRMKVFEKNIQEINRHNSLLGKSYEMGVNQFSHLTPEEFAKQYLNSFEKNSNFVDVEVE